MTYAETTDSGWIYDEEGLSSSLEAAKREIIRRIRQNLGMEEGDDPLHWYRGTGIGVLDELMMDFFREKEEKIREETGNYSGLIGFKRVRPVTSHELLLKANAAIKLIEGVRLGFDFLAAEAGPEFLMCSKPGMVYSHYYFKSNLIQGNKDFSEELFSAIIALVVNDVLAKIDRENRKVFKKFIKKPVVVDAFLWDGTPNEFITMPYTDEDRTCKICEKHMDKHGAVSTLEGKAIVCPGDWIVKGTAGEVYPCKPHIFEQVYAPAEEDKEIGGERTQEYQLQ